MKGLSSKRPRASSYTPQPKVPRGISEPRSAGARTYALGGVLFAAARARVTP